MFPRGSFMVRAGTVAGAVVLTIWMYLVIPPTVDPRDILSSESKVTWDLLISDATQFHKVLNLTSVRNSSVSPVLQKQIPSVNAATINANNYIINDTKILNPHPFNYVINAKNICKDKDIFLIVYVHTAIKHYKRRMVIRQTWGNPKYYDVTVRVVFVMGSPLNSPEVQNSLLFESEQYNDIVQEDFIDSYKNLTYKGVASLKWISTHCRHASFVLKTDDDIFVNIFTLLRHLMNRQHMGTDKGLLLCQVWYNMQVMRTGKWKISENEYKDDHYPPYCSGLAFTMSTDVAAALYQVSFYVPFFWVDDFYITGMLPLKMGIKHTQFLSVYMMKGKKLDEKFTGSQWYTYIFSHVNNLNQIQSVWNKLVGLESGVISPKLKFHMPLDQPTVKTDSSKDKKPVVLKQPYKKS